MSAAKPPRALLLLGCLLGASAVMSGAFGAHALEGLLTEKARGWYDTAVSYHAGQALAVLASALLATLIGHKPGRGWARTAGWCLALGILIFSGSLYTMAFTGVTALGMITPIGGLLMIIGWFCLGMAAWRYSS